MSGVAPTASIPGAGCPVCGRQHRAWPQRCAYRALNACGRSSCEGLMQYRRHALSCPLLKLQAWGRDLRVNETVTKW